MGNVNPIQILGMMQKGQNPQQIAMSFLQGELGSTPMGKNILSMAQNKDSNGLESLARNMCRERGLDFDKEFNSFKSQLGIK